ncbi:MAG: heavy-metal-associated domain-containing protein [Candidatus Woesearchaeota archaeon]
MKKTLKINGMHCKSCVSLIKMALEEKGVKANVAIGKADVDYDDKKISIDEIKKIIENEGYKVVLIE